LLNLPDMRIRLRNFVVSMKALVMSSAISNNGYCHKYRAMKPRQSFTKRIPIVGLPVGDNQRHENGSLVGWALPKFIFVYLVPKKNSKQTD